jgi:hypothetical protein
MSDEEDLRLARKAIDGDASSLLRLVDRRVSKMLGRDESTARAVEDILRTTIESSRQQRDTMLTQRVLEIAGLRAALSEPEVKSGVCEQCVNHMLKGIHTCDEHAPPPRVCVRCAPHGRRPGENCGVAVMSNGPEVEMCQCPGP